MYPHGACARGVLDLAGNVWEWCCNPHGDPRARRKEEPAPVLRGEAFFSEERNVRAALRDYVGPDRRVTDIGLRVALFRR
jgi:formylglycine-generating enzyme required for sulfatase activity